MNDEYLRSQKVLREALTEKSKKFSEQSKGAAKYDTF